MLTNTQLQDDVRAELTWDPRVDDRNVQIVVDGGIVTLTGMVPSYADKRAAEQAAERVFGVRAVANDVAVAVPVAHQRSDSEIAQAAVNALAWDAEVPDKNIQLVVADGWITLEGQVDWQYQRAAAIRAVRNLAGIRGVTSNVKLTEKSVAAGDVSRNIRLALERRADRTANRIDVEAAGGVVTLKGSVRTFGERRAVEGAAWSAPGVTEVRDEMTISGV